MARANAEHGKSYDVTKVVGWAFAGGKVCIEGVHARRYGDYDLSGLVEMQGCRRMYAMEAFLWAKSLVPMVRYDARFARAIGKWMANAASSALLLPRLLAQGALDGSRVPGLDPGVIGSELLTAKSHYGDRPVPSAETDKWQGILTPEGKPAVWPRAANYSLYGSSHVGNLGGIVGRTSNEKTLELDLLKTDFQHGKAYPTFLYYNPYREARECTLDVGSQGVNLYDTVTGQYLAKNVSGKTTVALRPDLRRCSCAFQPEERRVGTGADSASMASLWIGGRQENDLGPSSSRFHPAEHPARHDRYEPNRRHGRRPGMPAAAGCGSCLGIGIPSLGYLLWEALGTRTGIWGVIRGRPRTGTA